IANWIRADNEEDWNGRGCLSCRPGRHCAPGRHDQGYTAVHQLGRQLRQPRKLTVGPTVLDRDLPAFDIAAFAQALAECIREPPERAGRGAVEKTDLRNSWVLRVSRERPRGCGAAEERDERSKAARTISAGSQPTSASPQKQTNSGSSRYVRLVRACDAGCYFCALLKYRKSGGG